MLTTIQHGGALASAVKLYGGSKANWLDLSTGINPDPAPLPKINSSIWQALPDTDLRDDCLNAARRFYALNAKAAWVAAPGVQALIQLLPQLRSGAKAAILGPTYGEYAHVFQTLGGGSRIIKSIDDLQNEAVVIVVNPNNPDGRVLNPDQLISLAKTLATHDGLLIVDEAFCDLMPEISVASHAGMPGLLVLKSFGKYFGLAGVRLGFAAGHIDEISMLERLLGPWAVSGPALAIGAHCYNDADLCEQTARSIQNNSAKQCAILAKFGLKVIATTGLFQLVEIEIAAALYKDLAGHHILARSFNDQPNWLRLGLCKNDAERARLADALMACLGRL